MKAFRKVNHMTPEWLPQIQMILALGVVPFGAYYLGVIIRKRVFPSPNSPKWLDQFLLAIPFSLIVVAPLIIVLRNTISSSWPTYLLTIGIIIEHGMFMNEAVVAKLKEHLSDNKGSALSELGKYEQAQKALEE